MADVLRRALQTALAALLLETFATAVAAAPPVPHAPQPEEVAKARELFLRAQGDEARGDYLSALEKFERVAETKDTASVRFHLGYCSEKLGRLASALHSYSLALREAEREGNADVKRASTTAAEGLAPRVPHLTMLCPAEVPSCTVSLDGRALSAAELSVFVLVDPGKHHVSARGEGMEAFETDVVLHEHDVRTVQITRGLPRSLKAPEPATSMRPSTEVHERQPAASASQARTAAWITAGGAVALTVFGIGSFLGAGGAQDSLERACATRPSCDDQKSAVRAWDTLALASFVSAGVLAIVSTVLFVQPREKTSRSSLGDAQTKATFRALPGRLGVGATF